MKRFFFTILATTTLGLALPAHAGFEEGRAAYKQGDYAKALKELRPPAEQGNAQAQTALGWMYEKGRGVPQDYTEAAKWYRKAAEHAQWYRKAAEQGHADAQFNLGAMYETGFGVLEDKILAYALYNLSAAIDPSESNMALKNRDRIAEDLSRDELIEGQALTRALMQPGNFGKALDEWLAKHAR